MERNNPRINPLYLIVASIVVLVIATVIIRYFIFNDLMFGFHWDHNVPVFPFNEASNFLGQYDSTYSFGLFPGGENHFNLNPLIAYIVYFVVSFSKNPIYYNHIFFFLSSFLAFLSTAYLFFIFDNYFKNQNKLIKYIIAIFYSFSPPVISYFISGSYTVIFSISIFPMFVAIIFQAAVYRDFKFLLLFIVLGNFVTVHIFFFVLPVVLFTLFKYFRLKHVLLFFILSLLVYWYTYGNAFLDVFLSTNSTILSSKKISGIDGQSFFEVFSFIAFTHNIYKIIISEHIYFPFIMFIFYFLFGYVYLLYRKSLPRAFYISFLLVILFSIPYIGMGGHIFSIINAGLLKFGFFTVHRGTTAFVSPFLLAALCTIYFIILPLKNKWLVNISLMIFFLNIMAPLLYYGDLGMKRHSLIGEQQGYPGIGLNVLVYPYSELRKINPDILINTPSTIFQFPPINSGWFEKGVYKYRSVGGDPINANSVHQFIDVRYTPRFVNNITKCILKSNYKCFWKQLSLSPAKYIMIRKDIFHPGIPEKTAKDLENLIAMNSDKFQEIVNNKYFKLWEILEHNEFFSLIGINQTVSKFYQNILHFMQL
ncbi:MAG: hypothetical protein B7C24_18195 [Bacteroidetes bacterium 4572_77]|nr:MAG: hypothetical protein B7C24_18195 [Bacteroidetes bacterium 4572_77]